MTTTISAYQIHCSFTGKEKDSETGYYYFGARYYNSDLSLWLSVDPMSDKYPSLSPYNYCAWNPMKIIDPDGQEIWIKTDPYNNGSQRVKWTINGLFNENGTEYTGNNKFVMQTAMSLDAIYTDSDSRKLITQFIGNSDYDISLAETYGITNFEELYSGTAEYGFYLKQEQSIWYNPTMGLAQCKPDAENEEYLAPYMCLLHELGHAYNAVTDNKSYHERKAQKTGDAYGNSEEKFVIQNYEQPAAAKKGMLQRTSHVENSQGLRKIKTSGPLSSEPL